jgi:hypothetical protein
MNVSDLKALAKSLNITGYSKLRKAELIVAIGDACYDDAMAEYNYRKGMARQAEQISEMIDEAFPPSIAEIDAEYRKSLPKPRKSFNERMTNRLAGYHTQNGYADMLRIVSPLSYGTESMMVLLTPNQRKRAMKKYNRQYGSLMASLKK